MKIKLLLFVILSVVLFSCSNKVDKLKEEKKSLDSTLNQDKILSVYKNIKLSLRSIPISKNSNDAKELFFNIINQKSDAPTLKKYTAYLLTKVFDYNNDSINFPIGQYFKLLIEFKSLNEKETTDSEDDYPTIMEVVNYLSNVITNRDENFTKKIFWNSSVEHLVISLSIVTIRFLPEVFTLYELSKIDLDLLENDEIKPIAGVFKGIVFMKSNLYYMADEALSKAILSLENKDFKFKFATYPGFFNSKISRTKESAVTELHAITSFLRACVRYRSKDKELKENIINDLDIFLKDAQKLVIDNELTWLANAYIFIKAENSEKANFYLSKIENSILLGNTEKTIIKKAKKYLSERKNDDALNELFDSVFIGELIMNYFKSYVLSMKIYPEVEKTETGKDFIKIQNLLSDEFKKLGKGLRF